MKYKYFCNKCESITILDDDDLNHNPVCEQCNSDDIDMEEIIEDDE